MPATTRPRRSLLVLALVAGLLAGTAPIGAGAVLRSEPAAPAAVAPRADALEASQDVGAANAGANVASAAGPQSLTEEQRLARAAWLLRMRTAAHAPQAVAASAGSSSGSSGGTSGGSSGATSFSGRNHVWIPALGISRSITFYSCSSSFYPGNRVYRWGCAGSNNVYLFGHAYSVFKSLHDAYVRGRLAKGMKVYYANGSGKVSTYAISWWRLTTPDKGGFAYAAQSKPSLTLQTCVGAQSQYRLIVRLAKVG